jgi:RNA polymerase sporulation-specific sigma factor
MTEEQMVASYWKGDKGVFNDLVHLYTPLIRKYSSSFYARGVLQSDLFQEGCIGLYVAIQKYQPGKGHFKAFAKIHIKNRIINALKAANRNKHLVLNESFSLFNEEGNGPLLEILHSGWPSPEEVIIHRENENERNKYLQRIAGLFTSMERNVFDHFLLGGSYKEVAEQTGIPFKSVDNAFRRIKNKIKKFNLDFHSNVHHTG